MQMASKLPPRAKQPKAVISRLRCGELQATVLLAPPRITAVRKNGQFAHGRWQNYDPVREKPHFTHGVGLTIQNTGFCR